MDNAVVPDTQDKLKAYKTVCLKLGLVMCVFYVCRLISGFIIMLFLNESPIAPDSTLHYILRTIIMIFFYYAVPIAVSGALFKSLDYYARGSGRLRQLFSKPKRFAQNLGSFPAVYGLGQSVNLLTMLVFFLFTLVFTRLGGTFELERYFDQIALETPNNLTSAAIMVVLMVVVAPVAEEFLARGIMFDALKPFGYGIAIVISSILFGLMHSSLHMLFYTTALGLALGYVRYATNSLLVVTVLHMLVNAIAAGMVFILAVTEVTDGESQLVNTISTIYIISMLTMVVVGLAAFFKRIPRIRKYKIERNWDELSGKRKLGIFLASVSVIFMLILAADAHSNHILINRLISSG